MKALYLSLTLLTGTAALAQQPGAGFGSKQKISAPAPGLAERLNAGVVPLPTNRTIGQSLTNAGGARLTTQPLRLRVVRDSSTGLPVFIERTTNAQVNAAASRNRGARLSAAAAVSATFQFMGQIRNLLQLDNPEAHFTLARTETDDLGQTHVRLWQTHRGVPVYGAEWVAHLTDGDVTTLNGRYQPVPDELSTTPRLTLADASERALGDVGKKSLVQSFDGNLLNLKPVEGDLCVYADKSPARLAYQLTLRPNLLERWQYVIDAQTGEVLHKYNHTCGIDGPVTATARDLNGVTRSLKAYQKGSSYYLIDATRPMFDAKTSVMPDSPVGGILTLDANFTYGNKLKQDQIKSTTNANWTPTAVSAHYNAGIAYDYYLNTFKRSSINGRGGTILSMINVNDPDDGKGMDNAYWNGGFIFYGNGRVGFKPLAGGLDVAGHEMTHGVIERTANLNYESQAGAINESMADVFGVMIDRDNWTVGETVIQKQAYPSGAMRSFANPNQNGKGNGRGYQPKTIAQYENLPADEDNDNGGVHINSGIPNYAFYLFATNASVGKDKAEKVYYRALTTYLVRTSQFLDLRLAVIKAAGDLFGASGPEVAAARQAFDAVGIVEGTAKPDPAKQPDLPTAVGQDLLLLADAQTAKLYSTNIDVKPARFDPRSTAALRHRPSVTDNGQLAYFVAADRRIRAVNLSGPYSETIVSNETIWDNVAISKDGTKLAALTADRDTSVYVYSYAKKKWSKFRLYNPTYTAGIQAGTVLYADSFEWDFAGENIVYDAYNKLSSVSGKPIDYWDVGIINVWSNKTDNFAKGEIEKLFNLDEGESVGNPSFSKNSPDILAFDYVNEPENLNYVVATDLSQGQIEGVYENNTLGFPSYSRQDNKLVFSTMTGDREDVSVIGVGADKLSPVGSATVLYTGAKWPVWYTQATRTLAAKTAQTIDFETIADRYTNQGNLRLRASSSVGLPVSFEVRSGPATLSGSTLSFTGTGRVTVRAYQDGNAEYSAATAVEQTFGVLTVTATEPTESDALSVYPNPVINTLTVELPGPQRIENLTLRTMTGTPVLQPTLPNRLSTVTLEIGHLPKGLYLLQIQTTNGTVNRKVLKE